MKVSDVRNEIFDGLKDISIEYGFEIKKNQFSIKKMELGKELRLGFTYNSWFDEIQIFPTVIINLDSIMNISNKFGNPINYTAFMNLFLLKEFYEERLTSDTRWQLQLENKDRIRILNKDDLVLGSQIINNLFVKYGLSYYDNYSSVVAIDQLYNNNPYDKYNPHCSGYNTHCLIGLIAAKVTCNKKYNELSEIYSKAVIENDFSEKDKMAFFEIKNYLE